MPSNRRQPPPRNSTRLDLPAYASFVCNARLTAGADDGADAGRPITVAGMAVPWNVVVDLNWWGDTVEFAPGSLAPAHPERVPFLLDHDDHPFGYGSSFTATDAGLEAIMAVPREELDDARTATAVRQMSNGVRTALSIGAVIRSAEQTDKGDHDHYRVTDAELVELSSVVVPRFDDARIAAIAASRKDRTMPNAGSTAGLPTFPARTAAPLRLEQDPPPDDEPPDDEGGDEGGDEGAGEVNASRITAAGRRHPAAVVPYQTRGGTGRPDTSLAAVGRMLAATGGDPRLVRAALNNITTPDVTGLIRPQYVDELLGLLTMGTPCIQAFRQGNLTSNPVVFPKWTALPVVDLVAGEKVEIPTGPATIGTMSLAPDTYAGGNDASVQVLDWSSPDFITAYFQACAEQYARKIENAFETGLLAWATAIGVGPYTDLVSVIGNIIGRTAGKGLPGRFVLVVSGDVFGAMFTSFSSGGPGIWGVVSADFPSPPVIVAPFFPAGTLLGAMTGCAISFQNAGAPIRLRAVDVSLLGVDLGVYGYFAAGALYASGLWKATVTVPAPTSGETFDASELPDPYAGGDLLHGQAPARSTSSTSSASRKSNG